MDRLISYRDGYVVLHRAPLAHDLGSDGDIPVGPIAPGAWVDRRDAERIVARLSPKPHHYVVVDKLGNVTTKLDTLAEVEHCLLLAGDTVHAVLLGPALDVSEYDDEPGVSDPTP